jgi:hypothetical protein
LIKRKKDVDKEWGFLEDSCNVILKKSIDIYIERLGDYLVRGEWIKKGKVGEKV